MTPIAVVASAIGPNVIIKAGRRPHRSAYQPTTELPMGLIKKATLKIVKVSKRARA
jgi:hypothetical protein